MQNAERKEDEVWTGCFPGSIQYLYSSQCQDTTHTLLTHAHGHFWCTSSLMTSSEASDTSTAHIAQNATFLLLSLVYWTIQTHTRVNYLFPVYLADIEGMPGWPNISQLDFLSSRFPPPSISISLKVWAENLLPEIKRMCSPKFMTGYCINANGWGGQGHIS